MVIYKKASKIQKFCVLQVYIFFSLKFVGTFFVSLLFDLVLLFNLAYASIILSHITTESPIILAKYFPFSKLHVERFQF